MMKNDTSKPSRRLGTTYVLLGGSTATLLTNWKSLRTSDLRDRRRPIPRTTSFTGRDCGDGRDSRGLDLDSRT